MISTPRGLRLHLGFFGRRNAGKSSLVNALAGSQVAIVSDTPGTTTDPVDKAMELLPLGPVVLVDTAGLDDDGELGSQRVAASRQALQRCDLVLVVCAGVYGAAEHNLVADCQQRGVPVVVVWSQLDRCPPTPAQRQAIAPIPQVLTSALAGSGLDDLRAMIIAQAPEQALAGTPLVGDLVPPGALVVLVVPIDLEAPKGRLIMPQVQTIRDLLDHDCLCLVVKERELASALDRLQQAPDLVVTDSQAFLRVAGDIAPETPLTSFSILFARAKGDLATMVAGTRAIDRLRPGARVLIAESCSHHAIGDDIGRVKIPRWLSQYTGQAITFDHCQGRDFPDVQQLATYDLVVQCGSCTTNRRSVLSRIQACRTAGVPITNYGLCISYSLGIFDRAIAPFALSPEHRQGFV